jgi:two-component system nitrogen regulation response regulator GlnG
MLPKKLFVLAVARERDNWFQDLKAILKKQQVEIYCAKSCEEAARLLDQTHPEVVFTARLLKDGTWRDIIRLTENLSVPTDVVVVAENKDIHFSTSAMEYGAFDCILPPFEEEAIGQVVRAVSESVRCKRLSQARLAVA